MKNLKHEPDPRLDLVFERIVDLPPEKVWQAWTNEEHLLHWLTPAPWRTVECEINVAPGGIFRTVMRSPEGKDFPGVGCFLEVVPYRRLVWTNALGPCFRPVAQPQGEGCDSFFFTAVVNIEPYETGTRYTATLIHADEEGCQKHREMGFHEGWGKACEQMVAYMKGL